MARNVKRAIGAGDMVALLDARASGLVWGWCDTAMDSTNDTRFSGFDRGADSRLSRSMGAGRRRGSGEPANEASLGRDRARMGLGYWVRSSAGALLIAFAAGAFADRGAELYQQKMCANCHGREGSYGLIPGYPALGGQSATYLLRQMKDIRDGRRDNGHSEIMRSAVAEVTDEELEQIAAWLASRW